MENIHVRKKKRPRLDYHRDNNNNNERTRSSTVTTTSTRNDKIVAQVRPIIDDNQQDNDNQQEQQKWSKSKKKRMRAKQKTTENKCNVSTPAEMDKRSDADKYVQVAAKSEHLHSTKKKYKETLNVKAQNVQDQRNIVKSPSLQSSKSALQRSFQGQLSGSRFRILNEELYTSTSEKAYKRFQANPILFDEYHTGFRHQVEQWPINPVSIIVEQIQRNAEQSCSKSNHPTTTTTTTTTKIPIRKFVVADFGCGEAELAKQLLNVQDRNGSCPFIVHSLDLVARGPNAELITACDAAHTSLPTGSIDYGVFCLSLMGTNLADFIREGHRVLKSNGTLYIAEVRSRFESVTIPNSKKGGGSKGSKKSSNENNTVEEFVRILEQLGFGAVHVDQSNKMFLLLTLTKNGKKPRNDLKFTAKPCIYKRR